MRDRSVQHPYRYRLVKVPGTADIYDFVPAPGQVSELGTHLGKATLLKDDTTALYGLTPDAVPDDVLRLIAQRIPLPENAAMLAAGNTWYKGTTYKGNIKEIALVDSYTPADPDAVTETWDASDASVPGTVTAYVEGKKLTLAGNGTGIIRANVDSGSAFSGFLFTAAIDGLNILNTRGVTNMNSMFKNFGGFCGSNITLDVSNFDTRAVTDMSFMFDGCRTLKTLDLSSFDTKNVTDMLCMFQYCEVLTTLDLSSFDTKNVTDMGGMFDYCYSLPTLDVSNFDTGKVKNMTGMFSQCSSLPTLDVSSFDTRAVTGMADMFNGCSSLPTLDVSSFDTSAVTNMSGMFSRCSSLIDLDVSNFDTGAVTSMESMFSECSALTTLDLRSFDTSAVTDMSFMFWACSALKTLDLSSLDTRAVTKMRYMFAECSALTTLDLSSFDTSAVTSMGSMFSGMNLLEEIMLGDTFSFTGNGITTSSKIAVLPTPSTEYIPGADGNWYSSAGTAYAPADVPSNVADTYYASASRG